MLSSASSSLQAKDSSIPCDPTDQVGSDSEVSNSILVEKSLNSPTSAYASSLATSSADNPVHKKARVEAPVVPPPASTSSSSNVHASSTSPSEDEITRQERLHILDAIFDSFNICDIESLFGLIRSRFAADLTFSLGNGRESYEGQNPLFTYWNFAHEIYPDAMVKILERRIISVAVASTSAEKASSHRSEWRVECVYKFTGTRITGSPIYETFSNFMVTCGDSVEKATKYEELAMSMVRFITANNAAAAAVNPSLMHSDPDEARSCIVEVVLSFDNETQLIKDWSMELLAGDER